jgi:hypothetical protein
MHKTDMQAALRSPGGDLRAQGKSHSRAVEAPVFRSGFVTSSALE